MRVNASNFSLAPISCVRSQLPNQKRVKPEVGIGVAQVLSSSGLIRARPGRRNIRHPSHFVARTLDTRPSTPRCPSTLNSPTINHFGTPGTPGTAGGTGRKSESPMFTGLGTAVRLKYPEGHPHHLATFVATFVAHFVANPRLSPDLTI